VRSCERGGKRTSSRRVANFVDLLVSEAVTEQGQRVVRAEDGEQVRTDERFLPFELRERRPCPPSSHCLSGKRYE
jgi:hypothetical protein